MIDIKKKYTTVSGLQVRGLHYAKLYTDKNYASGQTVLQGEIKRPCSGWEKQYWNQDGTARDGEQSSIGLIELKNTVSQTTLF